MHGLVSAVGAQEPSTITVGKPSNVDEQSHHDTWEPFHGCNWNSSRESCYRRHFSLVNNQSI